MRLIGVLVLVAACSAVGCGSKDERPPEAAAPKEEPNLRARLADAQELTDVKARDDALSKVATAAANEGDVEVVEKALRGIRSSTLKDQLSFEIALTLSKGGHNDGALDVAKSISDKEKREQALKMIGKGQ